MSFDIFFMRSRFRDETVEKKNPFTGEVASVRSHEPLSDPELQAVQEVSRSAESDRARRVRISASWSSRTEGTLEVDAGRIEEGCTVVQPTVGPHGRSAWDSFSIC